LQSLQHRQAGVRSALANSPGREGKHPAELRMSGATPAAGRRVLKTASAPRPAAGRGSAAARRSVPPDQHLLLGDDVQPSPHWTLHAHKAARIASWPNSKIRARRRAAALASRAGRMFGISDEAQRVEAPIARTPT
jgi:hypothetical protein